MEKAKIYAKETGADFLVFTFGGNLKNALNNSGDKSIYLPFERKRIIEGIGADEVFFAPITKDFLSLNAREFLDFLNQRFSPIAYVSGQDYRFGKRGEGDVEYLKVYAKERAQQCFTVQTENYNEEKISTTRIKTYLAQGDVKTASDMLGASYFITGKVFQDRKIGQKLGFPTVNIKLDSDKFRLLDGVYKGRVILDGTTYKTVINYGARPTYDLDEKLVEAHIIDFDGNLYDREITLYFDEFMRSIKKFSSGEQLKIQLKSDVESVKEGKYD